MNLLLRLFLWPIPFVLGCLLLLSHEAIAEYAAAEEFTRTGRKPRRAFPLREWWVCFMRTTFPELR